MRVHKSYHKKSAYLTTATIAGFPQQACCTVLQLFYL